MDEKIRLIMDFGHSEEDAKKLVVALDGVKASTKGAADVADHLKGQGGPGGRGLLGASYAIQDFTSVLTGGGGLARALNAVTNNIDQMAMAAGASVATAAKLSIAFTGAVAALPIVIELGKKLWETMQGGDGGGPEPVLKALSAAEQRLEKIRANLAEIMKMTPPGEQTPGLVKEFIGADHDKVLGGLAQALAASGRGAAFTLEESEQAAGYKRVLDDAARRGVRSPGVEARMAELQDRLNQRNVEAAGKIIGAAPFEKGARDTLRAMAGRFPGAFPKGFGAQFGELEPEAVEAQDRAVADAEARGQAMHERQVKRRAQDKLNREVKALEEEYTQGNKEMDAMAARAARRFVDPAKNKLKMQSEEELHEADRRGWLNLMSALQNQVMTQQGGMANSRQQAMFNRLQQRAFGPNASDEAVQAAMIRNQEQITANMAAFQAKQDRLEGVSRQQRGIRNRLENNPMPAGNGR